jgi:hypothetical protein
MGSDAAIRHNTLVGSPWFFRSVEQRGGVLYHRVAAGFILAFS